MSLRLIVAVSGVTAGVAACAGRSESSGDGSGGTSGSSGTGGSGAKGGTAQGGSGARGGTGQGGGIDGGSGGTAQGGDSGRGGSAGAGNVSGIGGSSGTSGSSGASGGGTGNVGPRQCVELDDQPAGVTYCEGSFTHHPAGMVCPAPPRSEPAAGGAAGAAGAAGEAGAADSPPAPPVDGPCATDADCTASGHGYCIREDAAPGTFPYTFCVYACEADAACGSAELCSCESGYKSAASGESLTLGVCKPATCRNDGECDDGLLCISPVDAQCATPRAGSYNCQTDIDECAGPEDCPAAKHECVFTGDHWKCVAPPVCGRPFLVEGALRQSDAAADGGWLDATLAAEPSRGLRPELRAAVTEHWVRSGLMEHASVAAFARFALQLMALGAPAELVEAATRAMADETRHAKTCFGLASRHAGKELGPGPLDVTGALGDVELMDVVELVIEEGCIGETGAALEAAWAADAATDPVVREALAGIADDEARHAELAWRFVAWAGTRDARVAGRVEAQVRAALERMAEMPEPAEAAMGRELAAHGVLDERARLEARRSALRDVLPGVVARIAA